MVTQDVPVTEIYKNVTFPKETHVTKEAESTYQEFVVIYKLQSIIKFQSQWDKKTTPIIKVWQPPPNEESDIRLFHETGRSVSPIIEVYATTTKAQNKRPKILFLNPKPNSPGIYIFLGEEGIGAVTKIKTFSNLKN